MLQTGATDNRQTFLPVLGSSRKLAMLTSRRCKSCCKMKLSIRHPASTTAAPCTQAEGRMERSGATLICCAACVCMDMVSLRYVCIKSSQLKL